jgi:spermidine/putrescine transport system substrate-binding protein
MTDLDLCYMPADMKDAPEVVIPEEDKAQGELQVLCSPETQEIYTKIWTELQK